MRSATPQLTLRLDAASGPGDPPWRAGCPIAYLGGTLRLVLDTASRETLRIGDELHLPLPPAASPRQLRDAAESWLREEALRVFAAALPKSALARRQSPRIMLCFGRRGDWAKLEGDVLRCHWRLIEQTPAVIDQVLAQALTLADRVARSEDLFAFA